MCLARPVKVIECDGDWVTVEADNHDDTHGHVHAHRAYARLLVNKGVVPGDYLLVHGELAIHKLLPEEALKIIEVVDTLDGLTLNK